MSRPPLELLAEQWEVWGADLDPVLDDVGDLAAASARRICAAQLREALRAQAEVDTREITWDAAVSRLLATNDGLVLTARGGSTYLLAMLLRNAAEKLKTGTLEFHDEACGWGLWFRAALTPDATP